MKMLGVGLLLIFVPKCFPSSNGSRLEAEYYVAAYAEHYHISVAFVRAIVEQESGWQRCPVSGKGAKGLMQLMPATAKRLNVSDPCEMSQNISGGVRYLSRLAGNFHGDLRLVAAAYYAGERVIQARGLKYANRDVVRYVTNVRKRYQHQRNAPSAIIDRASGGIR
ncbi:MAG: soluble lytic murein transglycosylase [Acidobacteria bacterium]|nr:MAG: soluble lytic murein transglycosylase [Acidobacteriota bacterium]